jgi:cell division protein FtsA
MNTGDLVVGLDIGTTKIVCLVAEKAEDGRLNILARGESKSEGLRKGVVVNIESTANAIREAVENAEKLTKVDVEEVYVGIAGEHISSKASSGMVTISGANKIVSKDDVHRVIEAAKTINVPSDRQIIHVIPLEYSIDGHDGILQPVGMSGMRLTSDIHIVTASKSAMQNLKNSVQKAGLKIAEFVLEPFASSYAVLDEDEKQLGVCLIDIGGGTTDIAMYFEGNLRYTSVVPLGGHSITNDLSLGLKTPFENAEKIKTKYGIAHIDLIYGEDNIIEIPGIGGREATRINRSLISQIIQPRVEELFELALLEMKKSEYYELMSAGIVLTGGASQLEGMAELAHQVLGLPVKIEIPKGIGGLVDAVNEPKYATSVGLVKYAEAILSGKEKNKGGLNFTKFSASGGIIDGIKGWLDKIL